MSQLDFFQNNKGPSSRTEAESAESRATVLTALSDRVSGCTLCKLHQTRTQTVFFVVSPEAEVMFIGEGPGRVEDQTGRPFVGPAGDLLTRIIERGLGVPRERVYIANIVKCRPTVELRFERDRAPEADEVTACAPYLREQIRLIRPRVIITLGNPATRFILATSRGITSMRGTWGRYEDIPVMPTYHPSYLLRSGGEKSPHRRDVWSDIKQVLEYLGWPIPARENS